MSQFKTEQEEFWAGEFGAEYIHRNKGPYPAGHIVLFSRMLKTSQNIHSIIEFGSNIGLNLKALHQLLPNAELSAIEINPSAVEQLRAWGQLKNIYHQSILDFAPDTQRDLVLIKNVLIHINPEMLPTVYERLYQSAKKYILIDEYFNPTPVEVPYRGHRNKLFKRDFAGEMLDKYPDLRLVDYGFSYKRDAFTRQDDSTWFLLEKKSS
jgi:pseudaminic acid biosynthesis-associated methylase